MKSLLFLLLILTAHSLGAEPEASSVYDRSADQHDFIVFMEEGGWCWYQDPRVIVREGKLFIGVVRGNGNGEALVGVYDLKNEKTIGTAVMHPKFDRDDHNSPVFYVRPDGKILAVYARHGKDLYHRSRTCDPSDPLDWSEEIRFERRSSNEKDKVTYMNLYHLKDEDTLYNFFRFVEFNPSFVTSRDNGDSWSEPTHFFKSEADGRHRPYPRYASNGKDTVYISITDGHPRNFGNSLYYFEFRAGNFYRADGALIKNLNTDGPLRPSEAELVYRGSMTQEKPEGFESVPNAAWTSSIAVDAGGHPHIAYSLYLSNDDHRYRLASWDGASWVDREVAYAGKCLYPRESSYTGLITLDPVDPTVVFISTDVHPTTGKDTGGLHEIYRARIKAGDDIHSIKWEPVTVNSPIRNIRPVIINEKGKRVVLWNRGVFTSYTDYQLDTVGLIEKTRQ